MWSNRMGTKLESAPGFREDLPPFVRALLKMSDVLLTDVGLFADRHRDCKINTVEAVGLPSGDVCDVRERSTAIPAAAELLLAPCKRRQSSHLRRIAADASRAGWPLEVHQSRVRR